MEYSWRRKKSSKCIFLKSEVLYLGHVVGRDGVKPNPNIEESVKNWKVQTTVKEVQKCFGLSYYYRRFIQGFSGKALCLTNLT